MEPSAHTTDVTARVRRLDQDRAPRRPAAAAKIVPVRHYGRGIASVVILVVALQIAYALATNENIRWGVVGDYLFSGAILGGLGKTLQITVISMAVSVALSVVIATARMSSSRIIRFITGGYVFFFRGIPLIVLLILVGNMGLFIDEITIGVPLTDITWYSAPTSEVVTPFVASIIGLSLAASAYMGEIVRGGILGVDRGQHQAAKALGLDTKRTLRHIVLPQALRVIVPSMGNEFINVLKVSALVAIIAGGDLLTVAQGIAGVSYRTVEMMLVATIWYLAVFLLYSLGQYVVERRVSAR